ncbi:MAG: sigma-54-dependent Fis family transcriptional regulator, partial [Deltaproteobacteria bacterium]|nr:sigma-54-dependent Fis family transcriptional regulator [Deltaproteobacteria bacterium]
MHKTILIVDDEESICQSLKGILTDEGYDAYTAKSGEECLAVIDEILPDLILLDIWLPGMDGIETLKGVKAKHPHIQVVMISGHATIESAVISTKLGAFDFIEKPLSLEKVVLVVDHALDLVRLEEENRLLRTQFKQDYELDGKSE